MEYTFLLSVYLRAFENELLLLFDIIIIIAMKKVYW